MIHLLIDGYNLLHVMKPRFHESLESERNGLLEVLHRYQSAKSVDICVVFDGSQIADLYANRDRMGNVQIVYTNADTTADEWIDRECARYPGKFLVISSDREVVRSAERSQSMAISSREFADKLELLQFEIQKGENFDFDKDDTGPLYPKISTRKKGSSKKLPKKDRRKLQRLKNL